MASRARWMILAGCAVATALGCNAIFGIGDYTVSDDAGVGDGSADGFGEAAASCDNYDPASGLCYPCPPKADPEFLNACTNAQCVPFDDKARILGFLPDGGLPPVPDIPDTGPADGGPG